MKLSSAVLKCVTLCDSGRVGLISGLAFLVVEDVIDRNGEIANDRGVAGGRQTRFVACCRASLAKDAAIVVNVWVAAPKKRLGEERRMVCGQKC